MSKKTRILVIDDEEIVRLAYARTLSGENCEIETARDGAAALSALDKKPFDVVLLDLRMPEMDGMTVLGIIKARWPDSEVVVITGYPSIDTAKEAVRLGAYDYLAKPVGADEVINAARGALTRKQWTLHREYDAAQKASRCAIASRAPVSPAY